MLLQKTRLHARLLLFVAFLSCGLVVGCASNKPQIEISDDHNFSAINTFYVRPPLNSVNATIENHMMSSITSILQSKGLQAASKENADVEVSFFPSTASKEDGKSVSFGLGTGVFGRSTGISLGSIFSVPVGEQVSQYQNLQIDIIEDGAFIYSAVGSAELDANDSITIQKELTSLVRELLQPYPAKVETPMEPQ
ncbi:DUF4136 domain-containing protein [Alteromonas pelagimontana]|uniref:DUF4136 domain-containing protein n=2 Tax=Alteromonas pelagimontana TaxID=1858656 RepID=A0A6M4MIL8_9ALTE|nr:DUF4136 domain-containing protein [Alteromonas pelagimontana]